MRDADFEKWFKQYLHDNYLVEPKWSEDQPESIARQCARAAYKAGHRDGMNRAAEIAAKTESITGCCNKWEHCDCQCPECGIDNGMYEKLWEQVEQLEKENETLKALRDELFERLKKQVK